MSYRPFCRRLASRKIPMLLMAVLFLLVAVEAEARQRSRTTSVVGPKG